MKGMQEIFADLHIHIGRTERNQPVKITASRNMTFDNIIREASERKGIHLIGIIDAHSPPVQEEIAEGIRSGKYREHPQGGVIYGNSTCILGVELELKEKGMGAFHLLAFFPGLGQIQVFTEWLSRSMRNVQLSTQRVYQPVSAVVEKVLGLGGILIPAHVFTPFKSVYGNAADRLTNLFSLDSLAGVELGLSSDTVLADQLSELASLTFVTNSDAHSLPKIGREYNKLRVKEACFAELVLALKREQGRAVVANYGLNPKLGKYYRTRCLQCGEIWPKGNQILRCPACGSEKKVKGVWDRISEIADQPSRSPAHRPPYIYQVPLEFFPKLGKKKLESLLSVFGTEMTILHSAPIEQIASIVGDSIAQLIQLARKGQLSFAEGGGGIYGKVIET